MKLFLGTLLLLAGCSFGPETPPATPPGATIRVPGDEEIAKQLVGFEANHWRFTPLLKLRFVGASRIDGSHATGIYEATDVKPDRMDGWGQKASGKIRVNFEALVVEDKNWSWIAVSVQSLTLSSRVYTPSYP